MFLQYAIWGAWLPLLWPFLTGHRKLSPDDVGWIFAVGAIGAILAPFIAGQIADRYFATEKFLGVSHILGGILVWQLAGISSFTGFLLFSLLGWLASPPGSAAGAAGDDAAAVARGAVVGPLPADERVPAPAAEPAEDASVHITLDDDGRCVVEQDLCRDATESLERLP